MKLAVFEGFTPGPLGTVLDGAAALGLIPGVPLLGYSGLVEDVLASQVQSVSVQTRYGPDLTIPRPFEPAPPGTGDALARAMKPRIVIQLRGGNPITWSPYGDPRPSLWPWIQAGLVVAAGLAVLRYVGKRRS